MKRRSVAYKSSSTTWPKGMRDVIRWKHAALLALAILAAGCSSNSKKELPPAELTSFKEEVVLQNNGANPLVMGRATSTTCCSRRLTATTSWPLIPLVLSLPWIA